jgi:exosortase J
VLYYWLALRLPFLQAHAEMADYLIGFVLFMVGTALFVLLIKWKRQDESRHQVVEGGDSSMDQQEGPRNDTLRWKLLVSSTLIVLAASPYVYSYFMQDEAQNGRVGDDANVASVFPAQVGRYTLLKTWQARDDAQNLIYTWATYSTDQQGDELDLGVWSRSDIHYPIWCHLSRGEKPIWSGVRALSTANGIGTFQINSYLVDSTFLLEASTICTSKGCYESGSRPFHRGISFRTAGFGNFVFQSFFRTRPLLIRKRTTATASSSPMETTRPYVELEDFVLHLNTSDLGQFVKSRNR